MFYFILIFIALIGMMAALYQMRSHPKGLYILFFAEMWERFSFYGMRALLIFYLTKHFLFTDDRAFEIIGAYATLAYTMPVIGGLLADRFLGQRKAIMFGAILLVIGHFGMAFEGAPAQSPEGRDPLFLNIFYLSLAFIIAGVGFLKANISTIVGELYDKTDQRRDSAFTLFYVGINLGALAGGLIAGFLGENYGWRYGFGVAGFGMLLGLFVFVWGKPLLGGIGESPNPTALAKKYIGGLSTEWMIYLASFLGIGGIWFIIRDENTVQSVLYIIMAAVYFYIIFTALVKLPPRERNRIFVALFLITIQVLFWALFEQADKSLSLYTDREVDRVIFGQEIVPSVFQSLNPMYIILIGPLLALIWGWLRQRGKEPNVPFKFGLGVIQLGLGFLVLVWGAKSSGANLTPVIFIFLIYLLHTTGELCLSPVGLSAMTRLSTPKMVGLVMGAWFLASGAGSFASAQISKMTTSSAGGVLEVYSKAGWIAVSVGIGLLLLSPLIGRYMHEDDM